MAYGVLHRSRANGLVAGRNGTGSVAMHEEQEDRDRIPGYVSVVASHSSGDAEMLPHLPGGGGRRVPMRRLAGMEGCCNSEPVTADCMLAGRVCMVHEVACG